MLKEFRDFAMRGNVLDMAIGVIIGGAFGKIVSSLVSDVLMPPIGMVVGKADFSSLYLNLSANTYASLAEAQKAQADQAESKKQMDRWIRQGKLVSAEAFALEYEVSTRTIEREYERRYEEALEGRVTAYTEAMARLEELGVPRAHIKREEFG